MVALNTRSRPLLAQTLLTALNKRRITLHQPAPPLFGRTNFLAPHACALVCARVQRHAGLRRSMPASRCFCGCVRACVPNMRFCLVCWVRALCCMHCMGVVHELCKSCACMHAHVHVCMHACAHAPARVRHSACVLACVAVNAYRLCASMLLHNSHLVCSCMDTS